MDDTYRVVAQGLQDGFSSELATERLVALFKSTKERIQPLLDTKETVVKKGLNHPSATKYKAALERGGCRCRIEPDLVTADAAATPQPSGPKKSPYLDESSQATDPGEISLSEARLREVEPELLAPDQWRDNEKRKGWLQLIADQLRRGDSRAAVVVNAEQGIVAAYTDELDCVALLKFDPSIARAKGWQIGMRLLTVNVYVLRDQGIASDLVVGPKDSGNHGNFRALIADLLTDDLERLEYRKSQISEDEWLRALEMGKQALKKGIKPRDGRPVFCGTPAKVAAKTNVPRKATAKELAAEKAVVTAELIPLLAKVSAGMLLCFWFVWLGISHVRSMPVDPLYFMAWFGILFFGAVGFYCARLVIQCSRLLAGVRRV